MLNKPVKRRKTRAASEHYCLVTTDSNFVQLLALIFLLTACITHAQDCDASFGKNIIPSDCDAAIQDFIATSVRDEAWARGPVLRSFTRNRDDPTPRNVVPQGFPYKTCAIGFDLAGSSGTPVVDSYKVLVEKIKELVQACVTGQGLSKPRGIGGRMKFGEMVFVVTNPSIGAVQNTCLAFPKQHSVDLGECVAIGAARSPSPLSADINQTSDPLPQNGHSISPDPQASDESVPRQLNGTQKTASQQPAHQDPRDQVQYASSVAGEQTAQGSVIWTPAMRDIHTDHPDLFRKIAQQIAEIEAHQQIGHNPTAPDQLALQRLVQQEQQPAAPARLRLTPQQLAQQQLFEQRLIQQQLDQRRRLLEQQIMQEQLAQQQMPPPPPPNQRSQGQQLAQQQFQGQQLRNPQLSGQQLAQQQFQGQQLQSSQSLGQQPAMNQQIAAGIKRLRQQSASPPHRPAPQGMPLRGRPGSDDSEDTSLLGPSLQGLSRPIGQSLANNPASELSNILSNSNRPLMSNQSGPAEASEERPARNQRLANQSPAPGGSISTSDFDRMLQEYSVAGGIPRGPSRMSSLSFGSFLGPANSLFGPLPANEPDPNEVNQNPSPQIPTQISTQSPTQSPIQIPTGKPGKPPRPGRGRKRKDPRDMMA